MTSLVSFLLIAFQVVSFVAVIILLIWCGSATSQNSNDGGPQFIFGIIILFLLVFIGSMFWHFDGTTNITKNNWPTSLKEGVLYERVCSKPKDDDCFNVWLEWSNGQKGCVYSLKQDPPAKFIVNKKGEFVEVK